MTTGAGNIGTTRAAAFEDDYRVVGLDREGTKAGFLLVAVDLTSDEAIAQPVARCSSARCRRLFRCDVRLPRGVSDDSTQTRSVSSRKVSGSGICQCRTQAEPSWQTRSDLTQP